jgi:hypothetical protein
MYKSSDRFFQVMTVCKPAGVGVLGGRRWEAGGRRQEVGWCVAGWQWSRVRCTSTQMALDCFVFVCFPFILSGVFSVFLICLFFSFLFFFPFVSLQIRIFSHFAFSCFQNESGMNSVDSLRTKFHKAAGYINRKMDFSR